MEVTIGYSGVDTGYSKFKKEYDALGALVLDNLDGTSSVFLSDDFDIHRLGRDMWFHGILEVRRK